MAMGNDSPDTSTKPIRTRESICTVAKDFMKAFPLICVENTVIAVRHGNLFYSF